MLKDFFVLRCKRNSTLMAVDKRGDRAAATSVSEALRFGTESSAIEYLEKFNSRDMERDYEVVRVEGISGQTLGLDKAGWRKTNLKMLNQFCDEKGIRNRQLFRGRLPHIIALIENGRMDEARIEFIDVTLSNDERPYPPLY